MYGPVPPCPRVTGGRVGVPGVPEQNGPIPLTAVRPHEEADARPPSHGRAVADPCRPRRSCDRGMRRAGQGARVREDRSVGRLVASGTGETRPEGRHG